MMIVMISMLHMMPRDHAQHFAWRYVSKHHFDHVAFDNQVAGQRFDNA